MTPSTSSGGVARRRSHAPRSSDVAGESPLAPVPEAPGWQVTLLVTLALLGLATYLLVRGRSEALSGALATAVAHYWLPERRPTLGRRTDAARKVDNG